MYILTLSYTVMKAIDVNKSRKTQDSNFFSIPGNEFLEFRENSKY